MHNNSKINIKLPILFWLLLISFNIKAQDQRRVFAFNLGDEFQKETLISSNSSLQRGNQTLEISSVSSMTKSYVVNSTSSNATSISVKIKSMDNLVNTVGNQLFYSSSQKLDTTSAIQKALAHMINKPIDISVDKNGVILSADQYKAEIATDTLVSFVGITPEVFEKGILLSLFADLSYSNNLKKGLTWSESVEINKQKLNTKFWIEDTNDISTVIKFSSVIVSQMTNSNSNGTYIVDNASGLIKEKLIYSLSNGYQLSTGGTIYAVSRSTSISELTKKIAK